MKPLINITMKKKKIYDIVFMSMPDMLNPKLTASWEKGLDMKEKKEIKSNEFMEKLEKYINEKFDRGYKKVRGTTPSPKSNQNNPNYVRIILMLQRYNYFSIRQ